MCYAIWIGYINLKFCKRVLEVRKQTPTVAVLWDKVTYWHNVDVNVDFDNTLKKNPERSIHTGIGDGCGC